MPHITALYTYPVKSCGGIAQQRLTFDARGPAYDRAWMVVDAAGGFQSLRSLPALAQVATALEAGALRLSAPGLPDLRVPLARPAAPTVSVVVWRDACDAVDEGDEAAAWFSQHLGRPARLVRMADSFRRAVNPHYAPRPASVGFADAFPALVISQASLDDLNRRLVERGKTPVTMTHFRSNIVVGDCPPYAEDGWRAVQAGQVTLDLVKPCGRCVATTVEPGTGHVPDVHEPLATLNAYRRRDDAVLFGQNAVHRAPGELTVGDPVVILETA